MNRILIIDTENISSKQYNEMYNLIGSQRKKKVDSLVFKQDKILSVVSEIGLLYLISFELKFSEDLLIKKYGNNCKPFLPISPQLYFNISHTKNCCAVAICDKEIGIDIENISELNYADMLNIMNESFTDNEIKCLLNSSSFKDAFYAIWTRKEAFYKKSGEGLSFLNLKKLSFDYETESLWSSKYNNIILSVCNIKKTDSVINIIDNQEIDSITQHIKKWMNK